MEPCLWSVPSTWNPAYGVSPPHGTLPVECPLHMEPCLWSVPWRGLQDRLSENKFILMKGDMDNNINGVDHSTIVNTIRRNLANVHDNHYPSRAPHTSR